MWQPCIIIQSRIQPKFNHSSETQVLTFDVRFQFGVVKLTPGGSMTVDFFPDPICFAGRDLIRRTHSLGNTGGERVFEFRNLDNGRTTSKPTMCNHFVPKGCLTTFHYSPSSTDYLIEGCPFQGCEMIRIYDTKNHVATIGFQIVEPEVICPGPPGTLLVCDKKTNCLLQLTIWTPSKMLFHRINKYPLGRFQSLSTYTSRHSEELQVNAMSYTSQCDILVMLCTTNTTMQIKGIDLSIAQVVWQHHEKPFSNIPKAISSSPEGWMCVANGNNVLILDAGDGAILETLFQEKDDDNTIKGYVSDVIWWENGNTRLVIRHKGFPQADQITWCQVTRKKNALEYSGCWLRTPESLP